MAIGSDTNIVSQNVAGRQPVVLQVLPAMVTGGVERGTVEIASALIDAGWKAVVVSSGGPMVRELKRIGAVHIALPVHSKNPWVMWRNIGRLVQIIHHHEVDIVHARSRAPAWSAWAAARRAGCHFITTYHGTYNEGMMGLKRRYNAIMARGERVIAISDFIAAHLVARHHVEETRLRIIHRGVDLDVFDPLHVSPERIIQLAQKWRLSDGQRVIMLPGRLTRWKGQSVLIDALSRLSRRDIRCLLVGSDQGRTGYRQELMEQIRALGLEDVVHLVNECNDMPAAYMLTDVVVSASTDPEAFGRVVVEAQAMGRPVIVSDHGGARETILPGRTGWMVPPSDPVSLAEAIEGTLSLSEEQRYQVAKWGVNHVRKEFSRAQMCKKTLSVYSEVLGLAPSPMEDDLPDRNSGM